MLTALRLFRTSVSSAQRSNAYVEMMKHFAQRRIYEEVLNSYAEWLKQSSTCYAEFFKWPTGRRLVLLNDEC